MASSLQLIDTPNDDGSSLLLVFAVTGEDELTRFGADVLVDGEWLTTGISVRAEVASRTADLPEYFGWDPQNPKHVVLTIDRYITEVKPEQVDPQNPDPEVLTDDRFIPKVKPIRFEKNNTYDVRLVIQQGALQLYSTPLSAMTVEQLYNKAATNNLILCLFFAVIIMGFIMAARNNPNLFIRRIQGLEAVDEAIGRATEMGKPVLHLNGLDPLSSLSTLAAVNILGRIARRIADYDTELIVPCFDPVVMTVSQEVVKNAYMEAGRPDSYREDNIYFVTDQQFSYVATVCGLMIREKPAANFFLGYFYAESLLLAETGSTIGAIQIAGTDALAQLPFFITTCDYTLIGEELYAASAYLSREPMLLGSLKGQDLGKAFVLLVIMLGTILATFDITWLERLLTPLS